MVSQSPPDRRPVTDARPRSRVRRRIRAWLRLAGPRSLLFRRRVALLGGAVLIGLAALAFAGIADWAGHASAEVREGRPWIMLAITPLIFGLCAAAARRFAPLSGGSGIPQVIAAIRLPQASPLVTKLLSLPAGLLKCLLTIGALFAGGSVGREGPTVQLSAAILATVHRVLRVPLRSSAIMAGGAAGVAAAFNTPLAGVAFAIEELATAYEQRTAVLIMAAVIVSGMVSLGLAGDYLYFGAVSGTLSARSAAIAMPVAGVVGGVAGGLFSRLLLHWTSAQTGLPARARSQPVRTAIICGLLVAVIGWWSGTSFGTGYEPAREAITGSSPLPFWFAPAKFLSTLLTAFSGIPGGIFAPSLATGAGVGNALHLVLPWIPGGPLILLGMVAYFTGAVRAPLTAVIIIAETTASRGLMLPLLGTALIADAVASALCKERLYHGLAKRFG